MSLNLFNPEHDLCLANGDPNFVPPASALEFGRDCFGLTDWIEKSSDDKLVPWGWDAVLKCRLKKAGIPECLLPSDAALDNIRELSRRGVALRAGAYVSSHVRSSCPSLSGFLRSTDEVMEFSEADTAVVQADKFVEAVMKAPLSGSGRGLRWIRSGEISRNDLCWCRSVVSRQGSVMVEKRREVVRDFAMLFHVGEDVVSFEGYSLFYCANGSYRGNVLASDGRILSILSDYVPEALVLNVREALTRYVAETFCGKYIGFVGADMFIFRDGDGFGLASCVEFNVRMTMGLLARRVYDRHLGGLLKISDMQAADGKFVMNVEHSASRGELYSRLGHVVALTDVTPESRYAVWITPSCV